MDFFIVHSSSKSELLCKDFLITDCRSNMKLVEKVRQTGEGEHQSAHTEELITTIVIGMSVANVMHESIIHYDATYRMNACR